MGIIPGVGPKEFLLIIAIIIVLNITGLWPRIMRGISDLRGDTRPEPESEKGPMVSQGNLDMCYRLLGISSSATWEEVERAYRTKAKKHHPDHGGDEDAMRALNEAYNMLKKMRRSR